VYRHAITEVPSTYIYRTEARYILTIVHKTFKQSKSFREWYK